MPEPECTGLSDPQTYGEAEVSAAPPPPQDAQFITFAYNMSPGSFNLSSPSSSPTPFLTPPSQLPSRPTVLKWRIQEKKDLEKLNNHIPRPPNSFILFRTSFVGDKRLPVKANRNDKSKIIGVLWHKLSPQERREWDLKAKQASEEHKRKYPDYMFKPNHTKAKGGRKKGKPKIADSVRTERCVRIADLIAQGLRGDELDAAIGEFNLDRNVPQFVTPLTPRTQSSKKMSTKKSLTRSSRETCPTCHRPRVGGKNRRRNFSTPSIQPTIAKDTHPLTETNTLSVRCYV